MTIQMSEPLVHVTHMLTFTYNRSFNILLEFERNNHLLAFPIYCMIQIPAYYTGISRPSRQNSYTMSFSGSADGVPGFNMKKFESQNEVDEKRKKRQEEWEKVRKPEDPEGKSVCLSVILNHYY